MEDPELELGDETVKIFMTPAGDADDLSKEVQDFMSYLAEKEVSSDFTKRLDEAVKAIKSGEGWRLEYTQLREKMEKQYEDGKKVGIDKSIMVVNMLLSGETDYDKIAKEAQMSREDVERLANNIKVGR